MIIKLGADGVRHFNIWYDDVENEFSCALRKKLTLHNFIQMFFPFKQIDGARKCVDSLYFCNMVDYG